MPYRTLDISDRVALITGASSGIGRATARRLAEEGCKKLVLLARRTDRLIELQGELQKAFNTQAHIITCDLGKEIDRIMGLPDELPAEFAHVDLLVNNAGLALGKNTVDENAIDDIQQVITVNVTAAIAMASTFLRKMKSNGRGHVINIGSIAGHETYSGGSVYCASKHALTAFTGAARHDVVGTPVRVTCISPGAVETEFSVVRFRGDSEKAAAVYENFENLVAEDIADQIVYAATRPEHVQVADIVCLATNQSGPMTVVRAGKSMGASCSSS